jgi:hypothetical protein
VVIVAEESTGLLALFLVGHCHLETRTGIAGYRIYRTMISRQKIFLTWGMTFPIVVFRLYESQCSAKLFLGTLRLPSSAGFCWKKRDGEKDDWKNNELVSADVHYPDGIHARVFAITEEAARCR